MILIADSGSTKTNWALLNPKGIGIKHFQTSGINPFLQTKEEIYSILSNEFSLEVDVNTAIYFYGAGCALPDKKELVKGALQQLFNSKNIFVESDLMGAARSLLQHKPGVAAILGTGSNSCYYDGVDIVENVSPLGYILGDEGSGAVIGRKLLGDLLKRQLPDEVRQLFFEVYSTNAAEILEHVYKKPFPNRYMAGFTRFIANNIHHSSLREIVKSSFTDFFVRNISLYPKSKEYPIDFTGSVAWHFKDVLNEVASELGYTINQISENPIKGLIEYHLTSSV